jgi:hypothetical protein
MIIYKNINGEIISKQKFNESKEYIVETIDDITGHLIKEESVYNGKKNNFLRDIIFYLDENEDINDKLNEFKQISLKKLCTIRYNKTIFLDCIHYDENVYNNVGLLVSYGKIVLDSKNKLIKSRSFDISNNKIIVKDHENINGYKVWKYYDYQNGIVSTESYKTEVYDNKNREIAFVYEKPRIVRKIWYLEGKYVYNEDEELDFYYGDEWISSVFEDGSINIDVSFDPWAGYITVDEFRGYNDIRLPFLTEEIITYLTNSEPLVPPILL